MRQPVAILALAALAVLAAGCDARRPSGHLAFGATSTIQGRVTGFAPARTTLATTQDVAVGATVSLIDAASGNTVASTTTDASGHFQLSFPSFSPGANSPYLLEAVKGLAMGGAPNRAGGHAARMRTILVWNQGWQSLTGNAASAVTVNVDTTAVAVAASFHQGAGSVPGWAALVGSVDPLADTFREAGTGLSNARDFQVLLPLVRAALAADLDPLGAIAFDPASNAFALDRSLPVMAAASPTVPVPGGTLTLTGENFDLPGHSNDFYFGPVPAATWTVTPDRRTATITLPAAAINAPFTYRRPDLVETLAPYLDVGGTTSTLAGKGQVYFPEPSSAGYIDAQGSAARLNGPFALAKDLQGNLLVADEQGGLIRRITPDGTVSTVAGDGTLGYVNLPGTQAEFDWPTGLAVRADGTIFVAEFHNNAIRAIDPNGNVTTFAGDLAKAPGNTNAQGTSARFNHPVGLGLGPDGNLYVADSGNHVVRQIDPAGNVTNYVGDGIGGALTPGVGTLAVLPEPYGVAFDAHNHLFVLDQTANAVCVVDMTTRAMTLLAGGTNGYQEGLGSQAKFRSPNGFTATADGTVYVGDTSNNLIRKITPNGQSSTIAGTIGGTADGANALATFNQPCGLLVDRGIIYVADHNSNTIRVVTP